MSNQRTLQTRTANEAATGATTTLVRADARPRGEENSDLHPQLRAQLRELQLRTGNATPDVAMLVRLINTHYHTIDIERRGIVESMRLMADEARALALEARAQSSEHLQVILDHIKDVVLALDADGAIRTFNPTGERVFGYAEAELVGHRIDVLIPQLAADGETVPQALQRLAEALGDTALDLAASEQWARRKDGETFAAEIAVSKAPTSRREMFVLCLRDVTERRESEQAMRESEARYRLLVDHAPEAIVVHRRENRPLRGRQRECAEALRHGPRASARRGSRAPESGSCNLTASPPWNAPASYVEQALAGEPQIFEWSYHDGAGHEIMCEVRLVRIPSGSRQLVRGSIADISGRKRAERMAAAEREVFEQITSNVPLPQVLAAITRLVESVGVGTVCSVSVLAEGGQGFAHLIAPQLPDAMCARRWPARA